MNLKNKILLINMICVCVSFCCFFGGCSDEPDKTEAEQAETVKMFCSPLPESGFNCDSLKEEEVAKWLWQRPSQRRFFTSVPCPYQSSEEWAKAGSNIKGAEKILIDFYENYSGIASPSAIFDALSYIGTFRSVPMLISVFEDEDLDDDVRMIVARTLGQIGDPRAVEPICKLIETIQINSTAMSSKKRFKLNAIKTLTVIGNPKAIPCIEDVLKQSQFEQSERDYILTWLEELKGYKEKYVAEWLLRWSADSTTPHPRGLPPFRSQKKWINAGQQIEGIEENLLSLYQKNTVSNIVIFRALYYFGSSQSMPVLIAAMEDKERKTSERMQAIHALGQIGGPETIDALCGLIATVERKHNYLLKHGAIDALASIGDPNVIPLIEKELETTPDRFYRESLRNSLKKLKQKQGGNNN